MARRKTDNTNPITAIDTKLDEMGYNSLEIDTAAQFAQLTTRHSDRLTISEGYPFSSLTINFTTSDDDGEEVRIARMNLRCWQFDDCDHFESEGDIMDSYDADTATSWETALLYLDEHKLDDDELWSTFTIVDVHELYIDPKFRGLGFSKYFLGMIPRILEQFTSSYEGVVTTTVNPYMKQGALSRTKSGASYGNTDPKLREIINKSLLSASFMPSSIENQYVTTMQRLREKVRITPINSQYE